MSSQSHTGSAWCHRFQLTSRRFDEVIHAQARVADLPPVRRWIGLLPGTSLIDILPRLGGMFDGLVGDPNWVAENDPGILTFAHGQQGYRRRCFAVRCGRVREPPQRLRPTARSTSQSLLIKGFHAAAMAGGSGGLRSPPQRLTGGCPVS